MKMITREISLSGRCIYRLGGMKLFSFKVKPVGRISASGRPILVIRIPNDGVGLFCHYNFSLGWMRWAEEHGWRWYVDMRTPVNVFNHDRAIDFNPWELFFRQGCDAADLASAKEVLVNRVLMPPAFPGEGKVEQYDQDNGEFLAWRAFAREHAPLSEGMSRLVDARQAELFGDGSRVLGCFVRGTDYVKMKPPRHPVQPTAEQVIADAKRICAERGLDKVFLASEDAAVHDAFRNAFGSDLIVSQTDLPEYRSDYLVRSGALGDSSRTLEISTQYLVSISLLSRCSCLLAGCASGSMAASLLSKGFDLMRFYDLGYYK